MEAGYEVLREVLEKSVKNEFNGLGNAKCLYVHKELLDLLNYALNLKLTELFSENKIYLLQQDIEAIDIDEAPTVVFFLNPIPHHMRTVASMIVHNISSSISKKYYIYFVPYVDFLCVEELRSQMVYEHVQIKHLDFGSIPLAPRLVSLEMSKHCMQPDLSRCVTESLLRIANQLGSFKNIIAKGDKSKKILQIYNEKLQEYGIAESEREDLSLIMIDRTIDPVTPLITAQNYQSLLDFFFGINLNQIRIPGRLLNQEGKDKTSFLLLHNPKDPVYEKISYVNINKLQEYLKGESDRLKTEISEKKNAAVNLEDLNTINETLIVEFEQVQNHRSIVLHLFELMNEFHFVHSLTLQSILLQNRDCPFRDLHYLSLFYPPEHILRLLCLFSQVCEGSSFYSRYEREILEIMMNNYGLQYITSLYRLQKAQLLRESRFKSRWGQVNDAYQLLAEDATSYQDVHLRYNALAVRFIELILKGKMEAQTSVLLGRDNYFKGRIGPVQPRSIVFVYFVGGITYSEVACLRAVEKDLNLEIHIHTTCLTSGNKLVREAI